MSLEIIRLENTPRETLGVLLIDKRIFCYTLELPYYGNTRNISCIPSGCYECKPIMSQDKGETIKINNVYGRSGILIHSGSTIKDTKGCIIPGTTVGAYEGERAVFNSRKTMNNLFNILKKKDSFLLYIRQG